MSVTGASVSEANIAAHARDLLQDSKTLLSDNQIIPIRQAYAVSGYFVKILTLATTVHDLIPANMRCVIHQLDDPVPNTSFYSYVFHR